MNGDGKKALVAMSGGVDSAVAAHLLKERGFDCTGVTMKLFDNGDIALGRGRACCSLEDVQDARAAAAAMGIRYYVFNFAGDFRRHVIGRFVAAYQNGLTPNPCVDCNRFIKFEKLFSRARALSMDFLATGHYARIGRDGPGGRFLLKEALDKAKDQSYFLYAMTQEQLQRAIFPLGELCKPDVRAIAKELGLANAEKQESQDICFVRSGGYAEFIERHAGAPAESGDFVDMRGNVLGRHGGIIRYTVGQRRGLGIALNRPMFVLSKNAKDNTVTLCEDGDLFARSLEAADFNWIACEKPAGPLRVRAKIRYNQTPQWATAEQTSAGTVRLDFDEPQRAITPGQAAVLYDGDVVAGGGTIV